MPLTRRAFRTLSSVTILLVAVVLLILPFRAAAGVAPPLAAIAARDPVTAAWQRAQSSGVYHFATTVIETTHPAPTVANVGRSSTQQHIYLEGDTNLPERSLQMVLYQRGGSLLNRRDGIEVRIEDTSAYGRPIDGTWQEIDDFSGAFAPGSDLMAYLAGARNVREIETVAPSDLDTSTGVSGKETTVSASSVTPYS
ncbi:MAG: hypothetical protein J7M39_06015 [Anaerolineae bacterium]|nr:hypothetical protein [Anaerolineae bacterium]